MSYLQNLFHQLDFASLGDALLRIAAVLLCLVTHEVCHGVVAYSLGDPTAKQQHRLSLNPLRHIDWFGLAMMFVLGFGWAKPVPVDMRYFKNPKKGMALTALAGPISNFLLAFSLILLSKPIYLYAQDTPLWNALFRFLLSAAALSIGLGLFNLIPIPPLDGSKVLAAVLPDHAYLTLMRYERYGMILLLLLALTNVGGGLIGGAISAVYTGLCNLIY